MRREEKQGPRNPVKSVRKARVGLLDVANACGVSRSTASLVLRGSPLVAEDTRNLVMNAMERLGYVYHRGAAMLREGRTRTIGLLVNDIANPYIAELVSLIDREFGRDGQVSLLGNSEESTQRQAKVLRRLREYNVDGIIFCPAEGTEEGMLDELEATHVPYVQAMRRVSVGRGDYVGPDYENAMLLGVNHLISLGHKRIAYVCDDRIEHSAAHERMVGFKRAMMKAGLSLKYSQFGDLRGQEAAAKLVENLDQRSRPTAAICFDDSIAMSLMTRLYATGRTPGRDFAVVGIDDLPAAETAWPALTTVSTGLHEVAAAAASLLADKIIDPRAPVREIIIPARLVVRASCGA